MSPSPNFRGLLLCAAVLACTTVSDALVLLALIPIQLLLCLLFSVGLSRLCVSTHTAVWVLASGSGIALLRLTVFTPYPMEMSLLSFAALSLCGALAPTFNNSPPSPAALWRAAAVMLLTGGVREIVTQGTVLGLTAVDSAAVTLEPVGSLLVAAFLLWLFRLSVPVTDSPYAERMNTAWLTLAVCSIKTLAVFFLPSLSEIWVIGVTVFFAALLSQIKKLHTPWAPLIPIITQMVSDSWWHPLVAAATTALILDITASLAKRWRRVPVAASFSGSPVALALTAIGLSAILSF